MQTTVTRGWTSSELELRTTQLLELVYDSKDAEGGVLDLRDPDALGGDPDLVGDAARLLVGDQLVHGGETLGGIGYSSLYISDAGRAVVRARRERRTNRVERAIACREALLNWTYTQSGFVAVEDFAADVRAHFEGDPFTEEEIRTAAADLKTKGLVQTVDVAEAGPIRMQIHVDGKTVVENFDGSISAYERRDQMQSNVFHVSGNSGIFSVGNNNHITQAQGAKLDEVLQLVQEVTESARGTEVEEEVAAASRDLAKQATTEKPSKELLLAGLDQLETTVKKSASLLSYIPKLAAIWVKVSEGF